MLRLYLCMFLLVGYVGPSQANVAEQLRQYFEGVDAGITAPLAQQRLTNVAELNGFYRSRNHMPVWVSKNRPTAALGALLGEIDSVERHGLQPVLYHRQALEKLRGAGTPADLLSLELLASDAFLQQVKHRSRGAVDPSSLDPDWLLPRPEVDRVDLLVQVAAGKQSVKQALALWPASNEYAALLNKRAEIAASEDVERVEMSSGPTLKRGQQGPRVALLKLRLYGPGTEAYDEVFDAQLEQAVKIFQEAAGLEPDGIVGANTIEVLNASRFSWLDRIDANLERWRWLPRALPETHIRVNIASFTLRVIEQGKQVMSMDIVAGRPQRRTPVFTETLKYLVFQPYWNVPFKLATQDKLPLLKSDAAAQAALGYEARLPDGVFVPVDQVDWSVVERRSFAYQLRQRPGEHNALGRVKFMLPNPHAIYLHDTPSRELFSKRERGFSSGCIRLSQPDKLAAWVLAHDGNESAVNNIDVWMQAVDTRTVHLKKPIATVIVYFTAFTDEAGQVVLRRDIYQRDADLAAALRTIPAADYSSP